MKDEKLLQDEILSDEQLEQVVGGSVGEFARDLQLMNALNLISEAPSVDYLKSNNYENLDTTLDKVNKILEKSVVQRLAFVLKEPTNILFMIKMVAGNKQIAFLLSNKFVIGQIILGFLITQIICDLLSLLHLKSCHKIVTRAYN